jgi:hypothetical protein
MSTVKTSLPRLLYIGDVPVASTIAGAVQLYRLLQRYPASQLRIIEGNIWSTGARESRLPNVVYEDLHVINRRFLHSRVAQLCAIYLYLVSHRRTARLIDTIEAFKPEAILTVAHGFSWLTADALARRYQLPLHLIVHDDWPKQNHLPPRLKSWGERKFVSVYKRAGSRLCVSSYMAQEYEKRYGVKGGVLLPCRAEGHSDLDSSTDEFKQTNGSPVVGYFGSISSGGYARALASLAEVLDEAKGNLIIYSSLEDSIIESLGLKRPNIVVRKYVPLKQLFATLRKEVDALFVPMSFVPEDRSNMELSFPSKLTDYTALGLPIIIWGPRYCSAVRWATENAGVAEVVSEPGVDALAGSVKKLIADASYRRSLATGARIKGRQFFANEVVVSQFHQALVGASSGRERVGVKTLS